MSYPVNPVGNSKLPKNQIELAELKLKRKLGIEDNTTIPIGPVATGSASYVNPLTGKVIIDGFEAAQEIYSDELELQEEATETDDKSTEVQDTQAQQSEAPKKSNTNQTQDEIINQFKNKYDVKDNDIEFFEDGSAKISIPNSKKSVIIVDANGNVKSAKNITGKMLREYLFKDNSKLISSVKELVTGETTKEKIDNFNKGTFNITTDANGNLNITFVEGYKKPDADSGTTTEEAVESTIPTTTTVDIYGNIIEVETDALETSNDEAVEETASATGASSVVLTPNGTIKTPEEVLSEEVQSETAEEAVEETPTETVQVETVDKSEEETPTEAKTEETPAESRVEETPTETKTEETPAETVQGETVDKSEEEKEDEKLLDDETLSAVMSYVIANSGIEEYDKNTVTLNETKDGKQNIEIKFKSADGEEHVVIYNAKSKIVVSIDNQKGYRETNTGANETLKDVPNLNFQQNKERSERNKDVYTHNNISVIVSRTGTDIVGKALEINGKTVDGTIMNSNKVESSIPADVLAKINEVIGENNTADSTVYIENHYFDWGAKTEYRVVRLKDTDNGNGQYTQSVIYTFNSKGELKKIEYDGKEVDIYAAKNAANVLNKSIDEMFFNSTNIDNQLTRTTIETKNEDGSTTEINLCNNEWMLSSNVYGHNFNFEQIQNILHEDKLEKMKKIIENYAGNKIDNANFNIYPETELEENPIEGAEQYYEAIVCEVNGYKFIFELSAPEYCTIIEPDGNINRDYELDY